MELDGKEKNKLNKSDTTEKPKSPQIKESRYSST